MNKPISMLERLNIYESKRKLSLECFSPICILIDGIFDFNYYENYIQNLFSLNVTIKKVIDNKILLKFDNATIDFFNNSIRKQIDMQHYDAFSIFLKDSFVCEVINQFGKINSKLFYLYFEGNLNYTNKQNDIINYQDFKSILSYPKKYLYGFKNFTDLIDFYIKIISNQNNWPIFTILPQNSIEYQNDTNKVILDNKNLANISKSYYPKFTPLRSLFYISFIDKMSNKPQRILNAKSLYGIKKIQDAQISHIYNENKTFNEFTIRSFLGFENKFKCLHVYDFLVHQSSKKTKGRKENSSTFINVLIESDISIPVINIKHDLFYLEFQSSIELSMMFSMNNLESFNFQNSNEKLSTFLSFDNFSDFSVAKEMISSSVYKDIDYIFKNFKFVDKNEFICLFPNEKSVLQSFQVIYFLIFRAILINENATIDLKPFENNSIIMIKNVICSLDNKSYNVIGFSSSEKREEIYHSISNLKCSKYVKGYLPENKTISKDIPKKESIEEEKDFQENGNDISKENTDLNDLSKTNIDLNNQSKTNIDLNNQSKTNIDLNDQIINQSIKDKKNQESKNQTKKTKIEKNKSDDLFSFFKDDNIINIQKESSQDRKFEINEYIELMKHIYENILNFIQKEIYEEKDYKKLIQFFKDPKIKENVQILRETFYIILSIGNYHHRTSFFIQRIEKILLIFKETFKKHFKNKEIFNIFNGNKRILLILIEQKSLIIDQQIANIIVKHKNDYDFFFYHEIKQFIDEATKKEIESFINIENKSVKAFKQKRQIGENDDDLCQLIRNDSVNEFISKLNEKGCDFDDTILSSEFETHPFLLKNTPTYIQYAAFFGSIKIFIYYIKQSDSIDLSLLLYAIHGNNLDMVMILLRNLSSFDLMLNVNMFLNESIKCHHTEMTYYLLKHFDLTSESLHLKSPIKYYNFEFFPVIFTIKPNFMKLCKKNYIILVETLLNSQDKRTKHEIILSKFFTMFL